MTVGLQIEKSLQFGSVDEIPIVGETNAIGTVDVERLGLGICTAAGSGVSQVSDAHGARKIGNSGTVVEDLGGHTV